jgi:hypothetical protein
VGKVFAAKLCQSCTSKLQTTTVLDVDVMLTIAASSKSAFLADPEFPKSALEYFKGGRIILFQSLYTMYSKLAFSKPTDRSVALLGLEQRLAREFKTKGDFGILEEYLERSLLWQREQHGRMLSRIQYPDDRRVPSWSWMAYFGAITYMDIPFEQIDWTKDNIRSPFGAESRCQSGGGRSTRAATTLVALARKMNIGTLELLKRVVFDTDSQDSDYNSLWCVTVGKDKTGDEEVARAHYVLVTKSLSLGGSRDFHQRVGVGRLLNSHISSSGGRWVQVE